MVIFSTPLYNEFSKRLAQQSKLKFGRIEVKTFSDGELRVRLLDKVKNRTVVVVGTTAPPSENLVQLLLIVAAARNAGAKKIIAFIPYFGYSRADRSVQEGEAVSVKVMAQLLRAVGVNKIVTVQIHNEKTKKFFKIPFVNITPYETLAEIIKKKHKKDNAGLTIVAPDYGAYHLAKRLAGMLKVKAVWLEKSRPKANTAIMHKLHGSMSGKTVVLVDDMIDTAGTIVAAMDFLKDQYQTEKISVVAIHGILSGPARTRLRNASAQGIILADTLPTVARHRQELPALEIISIIPLLARELRA